MKPLVIGTRGSALARWQAAFVAERLTAMNSGLVVDVKIIKTAGDALLHESLALHGGKGLFVGAIEQELSERKIDLAVHSLKDVPAELGAGLLLAAYPERDDPRDVLVGSATHIAALPRGARVGTSSLRRKCQLLAERPDLEIVELRGNVDTRLRKLDEKQCDALILAAAGLRRLGLDAKVSAYLAPESWIPAPGQGALAIETRADDVRVRKFVESLHHETTGWCVAAERQIVSRLGGGCHVPIGAWATITDNSLTIRALVGDPSGSPVYRTMRSARIDEHITLANDVAEDLLAQGAADIIRRFAATP